MTLTMPNGKTTSEHSKCATILNSYFHTQFCKDEQITDLLPLDVRHKKLKISQDGVKTLIINLKDNKSPGPDQIRKCELLIDCDITASCLTHVYQASIDNGKVPTAWKTAHVTPIHKTGPADESSNYRPISLTSIPCKMLEHIVLHYLNTTLDNVLHSRQHGFRSGLSCETQLCSTYHDLANSVNNSSCTHAVALDFKKAFDKVPHRLLMQKIRQIKGIDPQIVNWVQDFLTNRRQSVVLQGTSSSELPVTSGVPQGSVLGPTLFLIYINDLPSVVNCNVSLYADDTLLYSEANSEEDVKRFQADIDAVYMWSTTWKMPFNATKCELIVFGNSTREPQYKLGNTSLPCVKKIKYLGVTLQSDLLFETHITEKLHKASRVLGCIKSTLHGATPKAKQLAYTALCRPILEYADTVWDPPNKTVIHKIEMLQNRAVRFIANLKGRDSVTDARNKLNLHTLEDRRKNHRVSLLMKILSNESQNNALASAYDELVNDRINVSMTTRAAARNQPTSIYASSRLLYNSFLLRTIRDLRISKNTAE
jgi:hypothetical protein